MIYALTMEAPFEVEKGNVSGLKKAHEQWS